MRLTHVNSTARLAPLQRERRGPDTWRNSVLAYRRESLCACASHGLTWIKRVDDAAMQIRRMVFRLSTNVKGWWFEAPVVESGGLVLFRSVGGRARTDRVERQSNPLGPFQPAGEGAATVLIH